MRLYFNLCICCLLAAWVCTACCKDRDDTDEPGFFEGKGMVRLVVADHRMSKTRATTDMEDAEKGEFEIEGDVYAYIYNASGLLEYKNKLPVDSEGKTSPFYLDNGPKKIYLFANRPAGSTVDPILGTTIKEFDNDIIDVTFGSAHNRPVELGTPGRFALGTLWEGNDGLVTGEGMISSPQRLRADIGRVAAKIRLEKVTTDSEILTGEFAPRFLYTVRSVPTKTYLLGKYSNNTASLPGAIPPSQGIQFISAVHQESPMAGDVQNQVFTNYSWPADDVSSNIGEAYYTVENTSEPMALTPGGSKHLYYGNTTYITLRTTYRPGEQDTFLDGQDPTKTANYTGGNFWIGTFRNKRQAFVTEPIHMDVTRVSECRDGVMYYHIPVHDPSESVMEKSYAVVRNHSYTIEVLGLESWGSGNHTEPPDTIIDPEEDDGGVKIRVSMLPWYSVSQSVDW